MKRFQVGMSFNEVLAIVYAKNSPWIAVPSNEDDHHFSVVHMFTKVAPQLVFEDGILVGIYW